MRVLLIAFIVAMLAACALAHAVASPLEPFLKNAMCGDAPASFGCIYLSAAFLGALAIPLQAPSAFVDLDEGALTNWR